MYHESKLYLVILFIKEERKTVEVQILKTAYKQSTHVHIGTRT